MIRKETIIKHLIEAYNPDAIIVYGSFADGSANEHSDFDALVIANDLRKHDSSVIEGTILDVFIYPPEVFQDKYNPEEFIQVFDGEIVLDKRGIAKSLKEGVLEFIAGATFKTDGEILSVTVLSP